MWKNTLTAAAVIFVGWLLWVEFLGNTAPNKAATEQAQAQADDATDAAGENAKKVEELETKVEELEAEQARLKIEVEDLQNKAH